MPSPSLQKACGFSLIEAAIAIVIIAALTVILMPTINQVRRNAWTTRGIENARKLIFAGLNYASEHSGNLPQTDFTAVPATRWPTEVIPYLYQPVQLNANGLPLIDGTFRCPGLGGYKSSGNEWTTTAWNRMDWYNVGGAYLPGGTTRKPLNTRLHANPTTPWLVSTDKNDGASGLQEGLPAGFNKYVPESVWIYGGGVIVAYIDGHVELVPQPTLTRIFKK